LIALVDDDAHVRHAIARVLRSAGYVVAEYVSGVHFLASLTEPRPDCVVLDLRMPVLGGFEVQEAIGRAGSHIPVILITADLTDENMARAMALGAACCLPKPVDASKLIEAIQKVCAHVADEEVD
jgi:FixJ family two-component response regulator